MTYKSMVVHLDTSKLARPRLEYAIRLAKQFSAHLNGVFSVFTPDPRSFHVMAGSAMYFEAHREDRREQHDALKQIFLAELSDAGVPGQWIERYDFASEAVAQLARYADLVIAGQDNPTDPESFVADHFPESLVMTAGGPVIFVPYKGASPTFSEHIVVAWNGSREAARAVHDALPLLKVARKTTVMTLSSAQNERDRNARPGADIALTLARHGVKVDVAEQSVLDDIPMDDMLLSQVSQLNADLLVMGAYGHSRWQELVMGGATRTMLHSMTIPVLMSH